MSTQAQRDALENSKFSSRTLAAGMAYLDALEQARCNSEERLAKLTKVNIAPIVTEDASSHAGTE